MTKVHLEAVKFAREGYTIVLIGHKNHDEVIGTLGEAPDADGPGGIGRRRGCAGCCRIRPTSRYLTQTTLSLDETTDIVARLEERFPMIRGPQVAGHLLCHGEPADGRQGRGASFAICCWWWVRKQLEFQAAGGSRPQLWRSVVPGERLDAMWIRPGSKVLDNVGVTAGASAPEHLVKES